MAHFQVASFIEDPTGFAIILCRRKRLIEFKYWRVSRYRFVYFGQSTQAIDLEIYLVLQLHWDQSLWHAAPSSQ